LAYKIRTKFYGELNIKNKEKTNINNL